MQITFDVTSSDEKLSEVIKEDDNEQGSPSGAPMPDSSSSSSSSNNSDESEEETKGEDYKVPKESVKIGEVRHTDRSTLRSILLHTLYYYNCPEKVDSAMAKIISTDTKKKEHHIEGEHYSELCVSDEMTAVKALQALDDATFSIHFVL